MSDLSSALSSAFASESAAPSESTTSAVPEATAAAPAAEGPGAAESPAEEPAEAKAAAPEAQEDEPTGDVLLDKLTPQQIAELKQDPRLKAIYKGLMSSYTPKMQTLAEQQRLWDALNNPETQRQAVEALARSVGLNIAPHDIPERTKASEVADTISSEWAQVVGPEAAQMLRPLIEKTALAAVQGTIQPLQKASEVLQEDARNRQADAQVEQFRAIAKGKGWSVDAETERKMVEIGSTILPAKPIQSVEEGVKHLEKLYRLATADRAESDIEKRVIERMQKAAQTAEPSRGVPSTGREKRTGVTKGMSFSDAWDVAIQEVQAERGR